MGASAIGPAAVRVSSEALLPKETAKDASKPSLLPAPTEPSPFAKVLHGMGQEITSGEQMIHAALHSGGSDIGPSELLALQAGIYRYTETIDLASKLIDHATGGLKTVVQGSGQ